MKTKRINGLQLEEMLRSGLNHLQNDEQRINDLNVFPVPDGDTGTNMRLTLEHGLRRLRSTTEIGALLKQLSDGMLLGARGNSGVILSQIFKGLFLELSRAGSVSAADLRNGFIRGYKTAYTAVVRPVEGTILTVAREGIENIRTQIGRSSTIEDMLGMYVAEMKKSLQHTPDVLPVLKESGVVDSGAAGFILIIEGMLKCLYGEAVIRDENAVKTEGHVEHELEVPDEIPFDENSAFEYGYCTEFILQRMKGEQYDQRFDVARFTEMLRRIGNSIVVVENGLIVKVHVHTMKPSRAFHIAERYGEFISVKVENMQIQHNEHVKQQEEKAETVIIRKDFAIVAVSNSQEMSKLFKSLGADVTPDGGETMNTSSESFLKAFSILDAKTVVVLPNNKNVIPAAKQAAELVNDKRVVVLPSKSFAEGYYALAMDVPGSPDADYRISSMTSGIERVDTLSVTKAAKDYNTKAVFVKAGAMFSVVNGKVTASETGLKEAIEDGLKSVPNIDEKEACFVFVGKNAEASLREAGIEEDVEDVITEWITDAYPMMEVSVLRTNQPVYDWIFGLV